MEKIEIIANIGKDDLIQGIITLVKVSEYGYYKTEIMNDDREYVIKLPKTLNDKINNLFNK